MSIKYENNHRQKVRGLAFPSSSTMQQPRDLSTEKLKGMVRRRIGNFESKLSRIGRINKMNISEKPIASESPIRFSDRRLTVNVGGFLTLRQRRTRKRAATFLKSHPHTLSSSTSRHVRSPHQIE